MLGLGAFGLIGMGVLDSSILFLPFGNDLLVVLLTARNPDRFWVYALAATAGSLAGFTITDWLSRKLGEAGLAVSTDITERRRAEAALSESKQRFRLYVDNVREYALSRLILTA